MADITQSNVFIQVKIKEETSEGQFNDSLYFTLAEFQAISDKDLSDQMQARVNNWVALVQDQKTKPPVELTEEKLTEMKVELEQQLAEVNFKLSNL